MPSGQRQAILMMKGPAQRTLQDSGEQGQREKERRRCETGWDRNAVVLCAGRPVEEVMNNGRSL